ncbi:Ger(x)C family spore germination protein [Cytobacillus sp. Hz8]|uniref:Ger(x)C family spore germination protein n=1 Tax=Cytobacillus sp. Hz8 TaxID=3347168 RepID=UPI0035DAD16F
MKRKLLLFSQLMLLMSILLGCWNQKELTDLAFIMALGIDKGKDKKYDVSFQVVIPENVSAGQYGSKTGLPVTVYNSSGDTITEAARKVTQKIPRQLYYAHTNLLVINEEIAKEGLYDLLDSFERDPVFRTTTEMIVVKDARAEKFISTISTIEKLPVNKVTKTLKNSQDMLGENMEITIDDFVTSLVSNGRDPITTAFKLTGDEKGYDQLSNTETATPHAVLTADGIAVFKDGKLVGWMTGETARGAIWIVNKVKNTDVAMSWKGKKNAVNIIINRTKVGIKAKIKKGKPSILISIVDEGNISEANSKIDILNIKDINKMETLLSKEIKKQVEKTVNEAQRQKSDIFGFGEKFHIENPNLWKKWKGNWNERFADLPVKVEVKSYIRRSGIRTNPFWVELNR